MNLSKTKSIQSVLFWSLITVLLTSLMGCGKPKVEPTTEPSTPPPTIDPFADPTTTTSFDVSKAISGSLNNYSAKLYMSFNTAHVTQPGGRFLFMDHNGTITVCINLCSSGYWLQWDPNSTVVDWTMNGILPRVGALDNGTNSGEMREIFSYQGDVSGLVGAKVYIGYGLGTTTTEAVNEMLQVQRYKLVHTIQ